MDNKKSEKNTANQSVSGSSSGGGYLKRYLPLLARPPVLPMESADGYSLLMAELFNELKPGTLLEAHYIEDVVYNSFQIRRLRQAQNDLVKQAMIEIGISELSVILYLDKRPPCDEYDNESKAEAMATVMMHKAMAGDTAVAGAVEALLIELNQLSWAGLQARALDKVMASYTKLEQMIHLCERQRQDVFKDFVFVGQAKAMLLKQRSDEAIAVVSGTAIPGTLEVDPAPAGSSEAMKPACANASVATGRVPANGEAVRSARGGRTDTPQGNVAAVQMTTADIVLANTASANAASATTTQGQP